MLFRLTSLLAERGACGGRRCARVAAVARFRCLTVTARLTVTRMRRMRYGRASRMRDTACVRLSVNHEHFEDYCAFEASFSAVLVFAPVFRYQVSAQHTTRTVSYAIWNFMILSLNFAFIASQHRAHTVCSLFQAWSNR